MDFHGHLPALKFEFFQTIKFKSAPPQPALLSRAVFPPQERRMFFLLGGSGAPGPEYKYRTLLV